MNSETSAALAVMALAALSLVVLILLISAAPADAVCLSKSEARKLWPTQHIYWYRNDGERCWSNRHGPPQNLKIDPIKSNETQKTPRRQPDDERTYRNDEPSPLDVQADKDVFFQAAALPLWPPVLPLPLQQPPRFIPWEDRITGGK